MTVFAKLRHKEHCNENSPLFDRREEERRRGRGRRRRGRGEREEKRIEEEEDEEGREEAMAEGHHTDRERDGEGRKVKEEERDEREEGGEGEGEGEGEERRDDKSTLVGNDQEKKKKAVNFFRALLIPGVIEYSLCLFFVKLVTYTFLFWLPYYITSNGIGGRSYPKYQTNWLSTLYDVGDIIGGILCGLVSDLLKARALTCAVMLYLAIPSLYLYYEFGDESLQSTILLLLLCGTLINGPYAIITTAVSADLGNHRSLMENQNAKATVTAIIDGTGSLGAAFGPLLTGVLADNFGWNVTFYMLMCSCFIAALMLSRMAVLSVMKGIQWLHAHETQT